MNGQHVRDPNGGVATEIGFSDVGEAAFMEGLHHLRERLCRRGLIREAIALLGGSARKSTDEQAEVRRLHGQR